MNLKKKIGYKFKNRNLLITALTHSSYANESRGGDQSYERLEFLGDSILGFVTAEYLCKAFPDIPEGKKPTKKRAALVCGKIALRVYTQLRRRRSCCVSATASSTAAAENAQAS